MHDVSRFQATAVVLGIAVLLSTGCGFSGDSNPHGSATSPEKQGPPTAQPAPASTTSGPAVVSLGPDAPELKQMKIEQVRDVPVPAEEVVAPAKIELNPNRVGHAVLPAAGRIVKVMVKLGDAITQGQPLIAIESSAVAEAETAYTQADVSVRQADVGIAKAEADLARLTDLYEHKAVAQKEVLAAQTTLALAKATREQAVSSREQSRRRLELLGLKPGAQQQLITVTAPVSGKVMEVSVVSGEFRNEINAPLVTIADLSRVWATADVPESEIRHFKVGGTASLSLIAYPGDDFRARITRIADTGNSETRTIKVNAELDNSSGRLRPEMFGSLKYADGIMKMPWVPLGALVRLGDKDYVFVEDSPGRFHLAVIELGRSHDGGYAVNKGLKSTDRIVTQGSVYLKAAL